MSLGIGLIVYRVFVRKGAKVIVAVVEMGLVIYILALWVRERIKTEIIDWIGSLDVEVH